GDPAIVKTPPDTDDAASAGAVEIKPAKKKARRPSAKAAAKIVEERIGHTFADPSLLATAFTHVSALKSARRGDSYQRL
ncbi:hypothetical protein ABTL93_19155, partial [Acinetobacter baumannii]